MDKRQIFRKSEITLGEAAKYLALAAAVVAGALLCVCHASCQLTSQGIVALEAEASPEIAAVSVLNASSIEVDFSKAVSVQSALVSKLEPGARASIDMAAQDPIGTKAVMSSDSKTAVYIFDKDAELGERYQLLSEIKDARGNSLTFALPFDGYNERLPACVLTEIQRSTNTSGRKSESPYVTIKALEDGNLFGIDLYCANYKKTFSLPKVEVKAGEEITLHLKPTKYPEDCVSELGSDLALAKTSRSSPSKRDIFFDIGASSIIAQNDVLLLRDKNANKVLDAFSWLTAADGDKKWNFEQELQKAVLDGAWQRSDSQDRGFLMSDNSNTMTKTRPLVRKKIPTAQERRPSSKTDWLVP